jgi:hypothetical protein
LADDTIPVGDQVGSDKIGGDKIGGDKVAGHKAGRDVITISDVSASYIAIGDGAQTIVNNIQQAYSAIDEMEKGIQFAERHLAEAIQDRIRRYTALSDHSPTTGRTNPYRPSSTTS